MYMFGDETRVTVAVVAGQDPLASAAIGRGGASTAIAASMGRTASRRTAREGDRFGCDVHEAG
jgi:hypothetical protein